VGDVEGGLMPAEEHRERLEATPTMHMVVLVNTRRGSVTGYPMTGLYVDGALWFTTYRKARKVSHLLADDRVCCVVAPPSTTEVTEPPLAVTGHARLVEPPAWFGRADASTDAPVEISGDVRGKVADRLRSGKRVVFRVDIASSRTLRPPPGSGA
jgi:hypothetical protein